MGKRCGMILVAILAILSSSAVAQVQKLDVIGAIVSVRGDGAKGDYITIDLGQLHKLKEGMTGDIYFEMRLHGDSVTNVIGSFQLIQIGIHNSEAVITDVKEAGVRVRAKQHSVKITHNISLRGNGILEVISPYTGMDVFLGQERIGRAPLRSEMPYGLYSIHTSETKYLKADVQEIVILPNETTSWDVHPEPKRGSLVVTSEPVGAYVSVVRQKKPTERELELPRETAEYEFADLPAGEYEILVEMADGYYPWRGTVEVTEGKTDKHVRLDKHAVLTIDVTTDGFVNKDADVFIKGPEEDAEKDSQRVFYPFVLRGLPLGTYTITARVSDPNFDAGTANVEIKAGEEKHQTIALPRVKVTLKISSDPEGMIVVLDGEERGTTTVILDGIETGKHKLLLKIDDEIERKRDILVDDDTEHIHESFEPGVAMVNSSPEGFDIYVDDEKESRGLTNKDIELPVGSHTITVKKPGYLDVSKTISVKEGKESSIHIEPTPEKVKISIEVQPKIDVDIMIKVGGEEQEMPAQAKMDLLPGDYSFRVIPKDEDHQGSKVEVKIEPGPKPFTIPVVLRLKTMIDITSDPPNIMVDMGPLGKHLTPYLLRETESGEQIKPGEYRYTVKGIKGYKSKAEAFEALAETRNSLHIELSAKKRSEMCLRSLLLPSRGYFYGDRTRCGWFFRIAQFSAVSIPVAILAYRGPLSDYNIAVKEYNNSFSRDEMDRWRKEMHDRKIEKDEKSDWIKGAVGVTAAIWVLGSVGTLVAGPGSETSSSVSQTSEPDQAIIPQITPSQFALAFLRKF